MSSGPFCGLCGRCWQVGYAYLEKDQLIQESGVDIFIANLLRSREVLEGTRKFKGHGSEVKETAGCGYTIHERLHEEWVQAQVWILA